MLRKSFLLVLTVLLFSTLSEEAFSLSLSGMAFKDGGEILKRYTCDGEDASPPLSWSGTPDGTKSYVIIMQDPDAPGSTFTHWVLYDLPASVTDLSEGIEKEAELNESWKQGINDFGGVGYGGPCSPRGSKHRYVFTLYALDTSSLNLKGKATKEEVLKATKVHVLSETSLTGVYGRE